MAEDEGDQANWFDSVDSDPKSGEWASFDDEENDENPSDEEKESDQDGDSSDELYHRDKEARSNNVVGGMVAGMGALLATTMGVRMVASMAVPDEDDAIAGGVAVSQLASGGGGGGGGAVAAANTTIVEQMAIGAAATAGESVAAGTTAASAAGAASAGAASSSVASNGGTATVAVAVAAAVAAGFVIGGSDPLCPGVDDPQYYRGRMAIDFLGVPELFSQVEASQMGSTFIETYDSLFGCDSIYSRRMLSCEIPCISTDNETMCCSDVFDPDFGQVVRCLFECVVHCDGCPPDEPLFLVEEGATAPSAVSNSTGPSEGLNGTTTDRILEEDMFNTSSPSLAPSDLCPECLITQSVSSLVCDTILNLSDCVAVQYAVLGGEPLNGTENNTDTIRDETENVGTLVPLPTIFPSTSPSASPSSNPSAIPSAGPSAIPSSGPSALPSSIPTALPTNTPSFSPTVFPSSLPSVTPSASPSSNPTNSPSDFPTSLPSFSPTLSLLEDLILNDDRGNLLGSIIDATIDASELRSFLTVEAIVRKKPHKIEFSLDGRHVNTEYTVPYFLYSSYYFVDDEGRELGRPFPPLTAIGTHLLSVRAYSQEGKELDRIDARYRVVP